jgi:hypothetical protein
MNVTEKIKNLCIFHATIIELGDENYYSDWIAHSCGLPDEPTLITLCKNDDIEFWLIHALFGAMLSKFEKENDISIKDMSTIVENGKKEGIIFYDALMYQMLEDMSV